MCLCVCAVVPSLTGSHIPGMKKVVSRHIVPLNSNHLPTMIIVHFFFFYVVTGIFVVHMKCIVGIVFMNKKNGSYIERWKKWNEIKCKFVIVTRSLIIYYSD